MNFRILTYEQAKKISHFVKPGVMEDREAESYWYLAAIEPGEGVLAAAVINPQMPQPDLLSIGVTPRETGNGIGSELLQFGLGLLARSGADSLRLIHSADAEEWARLERFLEINGFEQTGPENLCYVMTLGEIAEQKLLQRKEKKEYASVKAIGELTERTLRSFKGEIARMGQLDPDLIDACDPAHSFVWMENEKIRAIFLVSEPEAGIIYNTGTWISPKAEDMRTLQQLFVCALQKGVDDYPPETVINFPCLTQASDKLLKYLLPGAKEAEILREYITPIGEEAPEEEESGAGPEGEGAADGDSGEELSPEQIENAFGERQEDAQMSPVGNDDMLCGRCAHRKDGSVSECVKYAVKPGSVFYGGDCPQFEKQE